MERRTQQRTGGGRPTTGRAGTPAHGAPPLARLQGQAGNRAVAGLVAQRLKVGYPVAPKGGAPGPVALVDAPSPQGRTIGALGPVEPAQVTPVASTGVAWVEVKPLGAPGKAKGFAPAADVATSYDVKEEEIAWATEDTPLMTSTAPVKAGFLDKVKGKIRGLPPGASEVVKKGTPVALSGQATQGLVQAMVLRPGAKLAIGFVGATKVAVPGLKLAKDRIFHTKDQAALGPVKAGKPGSRDESAKLLSEGAGERAAKLDDAMHSGLPALQAFHQVSFALAGATAGIEAAYQQRTGRSLRRDLDLAFAGKPGKLAAPYLISMLDHDGRPSPKMAIALPLGKVDGSGAHGGALGKVVMLFTTLATGSNKAGKAIGDEIGKLAKDKRRVGELAGKLEPAQIRALLGDDEAMALIGEADKEGLLVERMRRVLGVADAEDAVDQAATASPAAQGQARLRLLKARDELLALMVRAATTRKDVPGFKHAYLAVSAIKAKITKGQAAEKAPRVHAKFDLAAFFEDVVDWKQDSTPEERVYVAKSDSRFSHEWAKVPGTLLGATEEEKRSIHDFIVKDGSKGKALLLASAKRQLELQGTTAGREAGGGRGLGVRIRTAIVEKRWASIEQQVKELDEAERRTLWTDLGGAQGVEDALRRAGLNKQERAGIMATLGARFGEAGGAYVALKELLGSNTRSEIGRRLAYLSPTKWSKAGTGLGSKGLGEAAYKVVKEAEDEDFVQIRQDVELLKAIEARSEKKTFAKVLTLLGMRDSDDQIAETDGKGDARSTRVLVDEARRAAMHDPVRWGFLLDDAIEEGTFDDQDVSAGTDKAALFVLITKAQAAAREVGRRKAQLDPKADPAKEAQRFLDEVVRDLAKRHPQKPAYLKRIEAEKGHPVWTALTKGTPIPVSAWIRRAEAEGFGVGSLRSTDRQKLTWAFEHVGGRALLDDWSNLHDFRLRDQEATAAALAKAQADQALDDAEQRGANQQQVAVAAHQVRRADVRLGTAKQAVSTFVLGIHEDRRADLRTHVRSKEERVSLEKMVTARLTKAMKDDPEIVEALEAAKLPNDEFMKAKMRAVDALESQRQLSTTRQWTAFSTSGSQLDEATRNVKASIGTSEHQQSEAAGQGRSEEEIAKLRKAGGKEAGGLLDERDLLEARFKDTQATFRAISDVLFTLVAQGLIIGLSMGMAAPLSIGIQVAIIAGIEALRVAYKHFVLGDDDYLKLAMDFAMNVVGGTVKAATGNIAMGLNSSILHPTASGLPQWFGTATSKAIGGLINETVMFAPQHFKQQAMQEKALEKVIKEGEDDIGDAAVKFLQKAGKGVMTKLVLGAAKEYGGEAQMRITGQPVTGKPIPPQKTTDQGLRDAFMGGGTEEEQEQRWKRLEKQHKKATKKEGKNAVKTMKGHANEVALEKERRKLRVKEIKGDAKDEKSPTLKRVLEAVEANKGVRIEDLVATRKVDPWDLAALDDDERGKVEEELRTAPGRLEEIVDQLLSKQP